MTGARAERVWLWKLRYLIPNLITGGSILFAVLAIQSAIRGEIIWGAWWGLYSTLTDKLDGAVARLLRASSAIGVQLDSLADLLNYGMVPATLTYALFTRERSLGWSEGPRHVALCAICVLYVLCAALRLARFNVSQSNPRFFFGIPTTMSGGCLLATFITLGKYGDPAWTAGESYPGWRLLGDLRADALMPLFPFMVLLFGLAMVSGLRVPKIGQMSSRAANIYIVVNLMIGYGFGVFHRLPEYLVFGMLQYLVIIAYFHLTGSPKERPEPLFPSGPSPA